MFGKLPQVIAGAAFALGFFSTSRDCTDAWRLSTDGLYLDGVLGFGAKTLF